MLKTSNWAIFAQETEVQWHFGDLSQEFIENTVNFLNGLDKMGKELFGSGVASISLDQNLNKGVSVSEVFVVSLYSKFFFIASDPLITMQLIGHDELPNILEDQMRGVLIGQASVLYANLFTSAGENEGNIDSLFHYVLHSIGYTNNVKDIVEKGRCSFSEFSLVDIFLFHYQIRKVFAEKHPEVDPWVIIADESGPIHLKYGNILNATSLAGYLSVLLLFCKELFDSNPKSLVFGGETIIPLEIINGRNLFIAVTQADQLFQNKKFLNLLKKMEKEKMDELKGPIAAFLSEKLSIIMRKDLNNWSMDQLIDLYIKLPKYLSKLQKETKKRHFI
ncbi:MAG: hypothetical protein ACFFD1_00620 [Candidatus Thorarchaeota archaeon]